MKRYDFFRKFLKESILDVGCSEGFLHDKIIEDYPNTIGIDIKPVNKTNLIVSNAELICFKESLFNTIVAGELIEHLPNPKNFLREAKRVLKKDGIVIITTPNKKSLINLIFKNNQHKDHISLMSIDELRGIVSEEFEVLKMTFLPYTEESSYGTKHPKLFFLRKIIHYITPKRLCENMIIVGKKK